MGQALYRKHRPKKLSEVIGQEHITKTLANSIKHGRISHAYLFTGPRGVGKTSVARILAHQVNGLDYKENETHLDIIEIDAASNRRIDEIRELRDKVHAAPTSAKYKVYIIDEVHMLTREAFNALLKTLEEPPEHAIFILATTESHKLPETIVSRTQRFSFKPIEDAVATDYLRQLAKTEGIDASDEALKLIAEHGNGSFRDSISLLDQARNSVNKLSETEVQRMLGIVPAQAVKNLIDSIKLGDLNQVAKLFQQLHEQGASANQLAKQLSQEIRIQLLDITSANNPSYLTDLLRELIEVPASYEPLTALQIALLDATIKNNQSTLLSIGKTELQPLQIYEMTDPKPKAEIVKPTSHEKPIISHVEPDLSEVNQLWPKVLSEIKKYHATLYSLARMAKMSGEVGHLRLQFEFGFHQKQLNEPKNKQILTDIIEKLTGQNYTVECIVASNEKPKSAIKSSDQPKKTDPIAAISNIFGNAEVIES